MLANVSFLPTACVLIVGLSCSTASEVSREQIDWVESKRGKCFPLSYSVTMHSTPVAFDGIFTGEVGTTQRQCHLGTGTFDSVVPYPFYPPLSTPFRCCADIIIFLSLSFEAYNGDIKNTVYIKTPEAHTGFFKRGGASNMGMSRAQCCARLFVHSYGWTCMIRLCPN